MQIHATEIRPCEYKLGESFKPWQLEGVYVIAMQTKYLIK